MIILFSGVSGCGKTTVMQNIARDFPQCKVIVSTTDRPMRDGESEANPYHFVSKEEFQNMIQQKTFFEYNMVHKGLMYGIPRSELESVDDPDRVFLKDIDVEGQQTFINKFKGSNVQIISVYLKLDKDELRRRLEKRGEIEDSIEKRLSRQKYEDSFQGNYDIVIENTSSLMTTKNIEEIIGKINKNKNIEEIISGKIKNNKIIDEVSKAEQRVKSEISSTL